MQQKLLLLTLASLTLIIMSWTNQEDWRGKVDAEILATVESGATVDFLDAGVDGIDIGQHGVAYRPVIEGTLAGPRGPFVKPPITGVGGG